MHATILEITYKLPLRKIQSFSRVFYRHACYREVKCSEEKRSLNIVKYFFSFERPARFYIYWWEVILNFLEPKAVIESIGRWGRPFSIRSFDLTVYFSVVFDTASKAKFFFLQKSLWHGFLSLVVFVIYFVLFYFSFWNSITKTPKRSADQAIPDRWRKFLKFINLSLSMWTNC